ncbi:ankyrin repeat-containing domain protein [Phyllosticta citrichinensis]
MACFLAVEQGHLEVVQLFLDYDVDPNLRILDGESLLHRAIAKSDYHLSKLLLSYNAKVDIRDWAGKTPLMANAKVANKKVLDLLERHGASMNLFQRGSIWQVWLPDDEIHQGDKVYATALYVAAMCGVVDVVEFFLGNGADASCRSNLGWTPLHGAAAEGRTECVRLLLERGADASAITSQGKTPIDLAISGPRLEYAWSIFRELGDSVNGYMCDDPSGFYRRKRAKETAELLGQYGAKTSQELCDETGQVHHQPWHDDYWAERERREELERRRRNERCEQRKRENDKT